MRVIQHDAVEVLNHMIAPSSLAGAHIYFPDPWHKKRHNKRRLVQPPLVALLASRLAAGVICISRPTGCRTLNRCWRCCRPNRRWSTRPRLCAAPGMAARDQI